MHLLDADTLITGERDPYPLGAFPLFWDWLAHQGSLGVVKIPREQYDEVTRGRGDLSDWLKHAARKKALLLDKKPNGNHVRLVLDKGYAQGGPALDEDEIVVVGQDPFLVANALGIGAGCNVVTFENSKPSRIRANRHLPDVCRAVGLTSCTLYRLVRDLGFSLSWTP
jgi:hypothetical protein